MHYLKVAKKYLIEGQIYVSLMGTALAAFFMAEQNIFRWPTLLLIFVTYFSGYLYTKYQRHRIFRRILIFNAVCGFCSVVLILLNHNEIRLMKWLVIVVLGLLYNSSFLEKHIRNIPLFKIFYVGLTWALINAWLIVPDFHPEIFAATLLFVSALVLPFDIRDMKDDEIVTFPKLIGVSRTKDLAYLLVFAGLTVAVFNFKIDFAVSFFFSSIVTFILIYFSENRNSDSYFSFGVESCSALPLFFWIIYLYLKF